MNIRGFNTTELPILTVQQNPYIVTPGTNAQTTLNDAAFNQSTTATTNNNVRLIGSSPLNLSAPVVYTALTPSIATIDSNGNTSWVSNGTAQFTAQTFTGTLVYSYSASQSGGQTTQTFLNWVSGSLAAQLSANVTTALNGAAPNPATNQMVWSTETDPTNYVFNTSSVLSAYNLTCISPYNSAGGRQHGGTLITPQDAVMANHYPIPDGSTIYYVGANNSVYSGTIQSHYNVPGTDIYLVHFTAPINSEVTPATIMPSTWNTYLSQIQFGVPVMWVPQSKRIQAGIFTAINGNDGIVASAVPGQNANWFVNTNGANGPISGDSGSPVFFILGGKVVLLFCWHYAGGSGPMLANFVPQINTGLAAMGSTYTVTSPTLTGYPVY